MFRLAFSAATLAILAGCAGVVVPQVTGGSKSDGVVTMSYDLGVFRKAEIDESLALKNAAEACRRWGFSSAAKLGSTDRSCISKQTGQDIQNPSCMAYRHNINYQCFSSDDN